MGTRIQILHEKMSGSVIAQKYQKCGEERPSTFQPGERFTVAREMERNVKGFREVSKELAMARRLLEQQQKMRKDATKERTIQTSYYKSVVGTRSLKLSGGIFLTNPAARVGFFSSVQAI